MPAVTGRIVLTCTACGGTIAAPRPGDDIVTVEAIHRQTCPGADIVTPPPKTATNEPECTCYEIDGSWQLAMFCPVHVEAVDTGRYL